MSDYALALHHTTAAERKDTTTAAPELLAWAQKMVVWLEGSAGQYDRAETETRGHLDSLADACKHDAANYRVMLGDGRAAIAKALEGQP